MPAAGWVVSRSARWPLRRNAGRAAWNQHVPAFLNAAATVGAFGHELVALRRQVAAAEATGASLEKTVGEFRTQIETRLAPFDERINQLDAAWNQQVPALLNAVDT